MSDSVVRLTSSTTTGFNFSVYDGKVQENTKYMGTISEDHKKDSCTCMGNTMNKLCKHIKSAHAMMDGFW